MTVQQVDGGTTHDDAEADPGHVPPGVTPGASGATGDPGWLDAQLALGVVAVLGPALTLLPTLVLTGKYLKV